MAGTSSAVAARMRGSSMINLPAGLPKMARHDIEEQQLRLCGFSDYKLAVKKTGRRYQGRERAMKRHSHTFAAVGALLIAVSAPAAAFAQKPGGTLRIPHGDSPASMSTHEEATRSTATPMMGVFNNLVLFDQHVPQNTLSSIVPDLALDWSWDEDKTALTFHLRQDVRWHDGKPFSAKDVKCTWDLLAGKEKLRVNPRRSWYRNLQEVTVDSNSEVTFHLKRP